MDIDYGILNGSIEEVRQHVESLRATLGVRDFKVHCFNLALYEKGHQNRAGIAGLLHYPKAILIIRGGGLGDVIMCTRIPEMLKAKHPDSSVWFATSAKHLPIFKKVGDVRVRYIGDSASVLTPTIGELRKGEVSRALTIAQYKAFLKRRDFEPVGSPTEEQIMHPALNHALDIATLGKETRHPWGTVYEKVDEVFDEVFCLNGFPERSPARFEKNRTDILHELCGVPIPEGTKDFRPLIPLDADEIAAAQAILGAHRQHPPYIGITMSAASPTRVYPQIAQVLDMLASYDCTPILLDSDEKPIATKNTRVVNMMGRLGLRSLAAIVRQCAVIVSNDTGTLHLAAAYGVPTVGIFSGIPPELRIKYYPDCKPLFSGDASCGLYPCFEWEKGNCVKQPHYLNCLKKITPESVVDAVVQNFTIRKTKKTVEVKVQKTAKKTASVVVCCHNNFSLTLRCLKALRAGTVKPDEIILIDNGSTDATPEIFENYRGIKYIRFEENKGVIIARNEGIKNAGGDRILLLDNDQMVAPDTIAKYLLIDAELVGSEYQEVGKTFIGRPYQGGPHAYLGGGGMMVNREVFGRIGHLDEGFSPAYCEDADFFWRAVEAGCSWQHIADHGIEHTKHQTMRAQETFDHDAVYKRSHELLKKKWQDRIPAPKIKENNALMPKAVAKHIRKPRVLLLPDQLDWALGTVAEAIAEEFAEQFDFKVFPAAKKESKHAQFAHVWKWADVVHWLSQYGFPNPHQESDKVELATVHHPIKTDNMMENFRSTACVMTFGSEINDLLSGAGFRTVQVKHGIDCTVYLPMDKTECRQKHKIDPGAFVVGWIGNAENYWKQVDLFEKVAARLKGVHVVVAGLNNENLCVRLEKAGVRVTSVTIQNASDPGSQRRAMAELYNCLDVLVVTSLSESGPLPPLEAMACGVPVVTTPCGHMPELIEEGVNGFIATEEEGFVSAIEQITPALGDAARKTAECWTWKSGLKPLASAYQEALKKHRVSVLMCVYNGSKYIDEAIESILEQTLTDFEFVIIDDGSTDDTAQKIQAYNDPRIRYHRLEKNVGLTRALNAGMKLCKGEYIARQDADDISLPTRLEKQVAYLDTHPDTAIVGSWLQTFGPGGNRIFEREPDSKPLGDLAGSIPVGGSTMRRDAVVGVGGHDQNLRYAQDVKLLIDFKRAGWEIRAIQETLYKWRWGHDHISVLNKREQRACHERVLDSLNLPRVGILVIAFNRLELTRKAVNFIIENTEGKYSLYLLNNGSTDDTGKYFDSLAQKHGFIQVHHLDKNIGCPAGRAYMMEKIDNELVAWIDDDLYVNPNWLPPLVKALGSDANYAAAVMLWKQDNDLYGGAYNISTALSGDHEKFCPLPQKESPEGINLTDIPYFSGGASLLRRSAFNWVYNWNEQGVGTSEDLYLSLLLRRHGYRIVGVPESQGDHVPYSNPDCAAYRKLCLRGKNELRATADRIRHEFGINVMRSNGWARLGGARILLIVPPHPPKNRIAFGLPPTIFPQGIGFVAASLLANRQTVRIVDFRVESTDIAKVLNEFDPDWIGVYTTTVGMSFTKVFLAELRALTRSPIVVGGPHATLFPETIPQKIDHIVRGEGERLMWQLVEGKTNARILKSDRITDLDSLPFPPWELLAEKNYAREEKMFGLTDMASMNTSRGCPFACNFCSARLILGLGWRAFSARKVIAEVKKLKSLGYKSIYFREDNFTVDKERVVAIANGMKELGMRWACETRVDALDENTVRHIAACGCAGVYVGVESGSQRILDAMNKKIKVEQIEQFFGWCRTAGIKTYASVIIGYPPEAQPDIELTKQLLERIQPDHRCFNVFIGMPGSTVGEEMKTSKSYEHIDGDGIIYPVGYSLNCAEYYRDVKPPYRLEAG